MTVEELIAKLRRMPRAAKLLALEPGCETYCEREVDDAEWVGHPRVPASWRPPGRSPRP
jgi:hypothetical protein